MQDQSAERAEGASGASRAFGAKGSELTSTPDGPTREFKGLEEDGTEGTKSRIHWSTSMSTRWKEGGHEAQRRGERGRLRNVTGEKEQGGIKAFGDQNTTKSTTDFVMHL